MKQRLWLLSLPLLVLMGMLLTLNNAVQPVRASAGRVHPAGRVHSAGKVHPVNKAHLVAVTEAVWVPQTTPTCTTHTTAMTLTTSSAAPDVGDRLGVTVTLANVGCGMVGLPLYRLMLTSGDLYPPYVLVPDSPLSATHYLGLRHGETDMATFSLQVIGVGTVTLQASVSFEVHLGYPGPAYWGYDATAPVRVTVPLTDTEIVVLQQAAYEGLGCFPQVRREGATYTFGCAVAAGHAIDAQIERFGGSEAAQTAFAARQETLLLEPFHCYPAYTREYTQDTIPKRQAWHSWLADRWIMTVHSWDDTGIPVSEPLQVSEAIYRVAVRNRLLLACDRLYLPVICKPSGKLRSTLKGQFPVASRKVRG